MECHIAHNILVVGFGVVEFFVVHYETTLRTELHILYPCLADLFRVLLTFLALVFVIVYWQLNIFLGKPPFCL